MGKLSIGDRIAVYFNKGRRVGKVANIYPNDTYQNILVDIDNGPEYLVNEKQCRKLKPKKTSLGIFTPVVPKPKMKKTMYQAIHRSDAGSYYLSWDLFESKEAAIRSIFNHKVVALAPAIEFEVGE